MSVFHFKRFDVVNERSAMKVNTDGVLLGAAMTISAEDRRFLDVGTGTGTIALMAAQRVSDIVAAREKSTDNGRASDNWTASDNGNASEIFFPPKDSKEIIIDAIDIDEVSVEEAGINFHNSPWNKMLHAHHCSLDDFAEELKNDDASSETDGLYDLIFSNPPYFDCSLEAPEVRRNNARHTSTGLSYRELLEFAQGHLTEAGRISMVLPADCEKALTRYARMCGLHLFRILRIRTVPRKNPSRIIAEFARSRCSAPVDETLTIQDAGTYTAEYLALTRDFYLFA